MAGGGRAPGRRGFGAAGGGDSASSGDAGSQPRSHVNEPRNHETEGDSREREFESLLYYLRQHRGFDFSGYKRPSLMRRVSKRMQMMGVEGFAGYMDYLEVHPEEFQQLFNAVLINVTSFFRDPHAWEFLAKRALPKLLAARGSGEPIRVWCAGCASGEEAYTSAMVLAEAVGLDAYRDRVKIYATELVRERRGAVPRRRRRAARRRRGQGGRRRHHVPGCHPLPHAAAGAAAVQGGDPDRERGAAVEQRGARDDQRGAAVEQRGARDDQRGAAVDQRRARDHERGAAVDERGAADGEFRAARAHRRAAPHQRVPRVGVRDAAPGARSSSTTTS